jgi:hypothetical protein
VVLAGVYQDRIRSFFLHGICFNRDTETGGNKIHQAGYRHRSACFGNALSSDRAFAGKDNVVETGHLSDSIEQVLSDIHGKPHFLKPRGTGKK